VIGRLCLLAAVAGCASGPARSDRVRATDDFGKRAYAAAVECGLRETDIRISDRAGERSFIVQPSAMQMPGTAFICFLNWARENDVRVGFIAEPPPEKS
jgi:hypothetical protein